MMRSPLKSFLLVLALGLLAASCTTYKQYGYLQDIKDVELGEFSTNYEAIIKKDDRLRITVFGPDSKVVAPYNLCFGENISTSGGNSQYTYLVDKRGEITFPVLGLLHVEGMTRRDLELYLMDRIGKDVKNPTVLVEFYNYTITVLGDVGGPGNIKMESERISIFKAIAQAGDLNITARRDNVLLVREVDGKPTYHVINLKHAELLSDELYFLQQNDILYVTPGAAADTNRTLSFWLSIIGAISSVSAVVVAVLALVK